MTKPQFMDVNFKFLWFEVCISFKSKAELIVIAFKLITFYPVQQGTFIYQDPSMCFQETRKARPKTFSRIS